MKLEQNHSTLKQSMLQEGESLLNPPDVEKKAKVAELFENSPWAQQSNSVKEYIPVHDDG